MHIACLNLWDDSDVMFYEKNVLVIFSESLEIFVILPALCYDPKPMYSSFFQFLVVTVRQLK